MKRELVREAVEDAFGATAAVVSDPRAEGTHVVDPEAPVDVRGRRSPARNPRGVAHTALGGMLATTGRRPQDGKARAVFPRSSG
jgi:hypothetical protein